MLPSYSTNSGIIPVEWVELLGMTEMQLRLSNPSKLDHARFRRGSHL